MEKILKESLLKKKKKKLPSLLFTTIPTDVDNSDLSPTTVTDKTAHEPLVL